MKTMIIAAAAITLSGLAPAAYASSREEEGWWGYGPVKAAGTNWCLTAPDADDGARVWLRPCTGASDQQWGLTCVPSPDRQTAVTCKQGEGIIISAEADQDTGQPLTLSVDADDTGAVVLGVRPVRIRYQESGRTWSLCISAHGGACVSTFPDPRGKEDFVFWSYYNTERYLKSWVLPRWFWGEKSA